MPIDRIRPLPGINWNIDEQLSILQKYTYSSELINIPLSRVPGLSFHFNNHAFESGDAEYLYNTIRHTQPKRVFEIGSGHSTLMALKAINKNLSAIPNHKCRHLCIEPYEMPWLEKTGADIIRKKVEEVDLSLFAELDANDLLIIDSSHMIRPQGDVLYEYLELIPTLRKGVIVHLHDIFSPRDYLKEWITEDVRFWNEQYLLEAFLTFNRDWKILGALNFLKNNYYNELSAVCPYLTNDREPGSFYIQRI